MAGKRFYLRECCEDFPEVLAKIIYMVLRQEPGRVCLRAVNVARQPDKSFMSEKITVFPADAFPQAEGFGAGIDFKEQVQPVPAHAGFREGDTPVQNALYGIAHGASVIV